MKTELKSAKFKDNWIYYFICPAIAMLSVHIGNENSFESLLKIPSYYSDLILAFACSYLTAFYIRMLFYKYFLTAKWSKKDYRSLFLLGILAPTAIIISIEAIYLEFILEIPLANSSIFYLELPLVFTFCLLINLFYINLTNTLQKKHLENSLTIHKTIIEESTRHRNFNFLVYSGNKTITVEPSNVAYIFVHEKSIFILTKEGKEFLYNSTLEKIEQKLDPELYFRLNRKAIVRKDAIQSFERLASRKLKVNVLPVSKEPFFVSKSNATKFQNWMLRN